MDLGMMNKLENSRFIVYSLVFSASCVNFISSYGISLHTIVPLHNVQLGSWSRKPTQIWSAEVR